MTRKKLASGGVVQAGGPLVGSPDCVIPAGWLEVADKSGNRTTITRAHYDRWPSVRETFRPVADEETTPVVVEPPTGDKEKEN